MGPARSFSLEAPPGFRLDLTVWALRRRAHNEVDAWDGKWYRRTVVLGGEPLEMSVRDGPTVGGKRALFVELRAAKGRPGASASYEAGRLLERSLGLRADLSGFYALAASDPRLAPLAERFFGMRPPRFPNIFETLVNAIACQQLSLDVGIHLLNRVAHLCGPAVKGGSGRAGFPLPEALAGANEEDLRPLGFSRAKARAITRLARMVVDGEVELGSLEEASDESAMATLARLPGIGRWSAEYTLLRGLGRWHVLPGDDVGARNSLRRRFGLPGDGGYEAVQQLSKQWWPYGGLVYFHLLLDSLAAHGQVDPGRCA
jgi:DNA-3-methyladenine glycosylase II